MWVYGNVKLIQIGQKLRQKQESGSRENKVNRTWWMITWLYGREELGWWRWEKN